MKSQISILIIAHNEERHIRKCLDSVLLQSIEPDEIVVIVHNSTDKTLDIVSEYENITVHELKTEAKGPHIAREYGFQKVTGDIIACLDGDSYVVSDWLEHITEPFTDTHIHSVSGFPVLLYHRWISYLFFLQGVFPFSRIFHFYFWGANFACRKSSYMGTGGMKKCETIAKKLDLYYPTEDAILSFLLQKIGGIAFAPGAKSYVYLGQFFDAHHRGKKQRSDLKKIKKYFQKNSISS